MSVSFITSISGGQLPSNVLAPDTVQRHPLGFMVDVYDSTYGARKLIYGKSAAALVYGNPVILDKDFVATTMPTAIAQGKPIAFAATAFGAANYYGWFVIQGYAAAAADSAVAADGALFAHAAGRLGATGVGKQIVGVNCVQTSSRTIAKTAQGSNGSKVIQVNDPSGWFVGMALSGTGVGSSAKITVIEPDGKVTVDVANSAAINGTVTGTFNDGTIHWLTVFCNAPASIV